MSAENDGPIAAGLVTKIRVCAGEGHGGHLPMVSFSMGTTPAADAMIAIANGAEAVELEVRELPGVALLNGIHLSPEDALQIASQLTMAALAVSVLRPGDPS